VNYEQQVGKPTCAASGSWSGDKPLSGIQTFKGFASGSRAYTLTCTNSSGSTARTVMVTIGEGLEEAASDIWMGAGGVASIPEGGGEPLDGQVVIQRRTYIFAGQAVAVKVTGDPDGNDGRFYLYSDHLGSSSAMTDAAGNLVGNVTRYLPFGGYRTGSGPNEVTDRGFTGQKENGYIKLIDMQARRYDPAIGRFISPDTIIPDPADPQSFNRYSYVLNSPFNYSDPSGHNPMWCNDPYDGGGGPECDPLVNFTVNDDAETELEWTFAEQMTIMSSAAMVDFALMREGTTFLEVYHGQVTFHKTGQTCEAATTFAGCWGRSTGRKIRPHLIVEG